MSSPRSRLIPPSPKSEEFQRQGSRPLINTGDDPIKMFEEWLSLANTSEINDPNAMSLATTDESGLPDVRIVLLKGVTSEGFSFFTSSLSKKGRQLKSNSAAALLFHWKSQRRQVRIRGNVDPLPESDADEYFASRSLQSQLAAIASEQSSPLPSRQEFEDKVTELRKQFKDSAQVPRPKHWGGYMLAPEEIEFWQDQPFRMHDRLLYQRHGNGWQSSRLYP